MKFLGMVWRKLVADRFNNLQAAWVMRYVTARGFYIVRMQMVAGTTYIVAENGMRYRIGRAEK